MAQHYFDPQHASDPRRLPDLEVFFRTDAANAVDGWKDDDGDLIPGGWFWWPCLPGCLPDGLPSGPFPSERAALDDARGCADCYSGD